MEVKIVDPDDYNERAIVYVSYRCKSEYGLDQSKLPNFRLTSLRETSSRSRRNVWRISPKCFGWQDVLYESYNDVDLKSDADENIGR